MSYIVPRKKPDRCTNCLFIDKITYDCKLMYGNDYPDFESQYANCPLIEIPTPHSDLVDRDALIAEYDRQHKGPVGGARQIMVDAKAVIKADGYQRQWVDWHTKGREE